MRITEICFELSLSAKKLGGREGENRGICGKAHVNQIKGENGSFDELVCVFADLICGYTGEGM